MILAKCQSNVYIQIPQAALSFIGKTKECPDECPNKGNCRGSFDLNTENLILKDEDRYFNRTIGLIRYTADELRSIFGIYSAPFTSPDIGSKSAILDPPVIEKREPVIVERPKTPLTSKQTGKRINVGNDIYTNDDTLLLKYPRFFSLRNGLKRIFEYWECGIVFDNARCDKLNQEFIDLICAFSERTLYEEDVDAIIKNPSFDKNQKFFHLFYDVIYRDCPPRGFYWSDFERTTINTPKFFDESDFISKLQTDPEIERLYRERKSEVLHFLKCESEEQLSERLTLKRSREMNNVIWVDPKDNFTETNLGAISSFIDFLKNPDSLFIMDKKIKFLRKYTVKSGTIVKRQSDNLSYLNSTQRGKDAREVFDAVSISKIGDRQAAYDCYVTLLREYINEKSPEILEFGKLKFTKSKTEREITGIIYDYIKQQFVHSSSSKTLLDEKRGQALLAKSLYERGVFDCFTSNSAINVSEAMSLLDKVDSGAYTLSDHLSANMTGDTADISKKFKDDMIIKALITSKGSRAITTMVQSACNKYQKSYDTFTEE